MATSAAIGKSILFGAISLFLYVFFWISVLPFMLIDDDNWIYSYFPPMSYAFTAPILLGSIFAGSMMIVTMFYTRSFISFI